MKNLKKKALVSAIAGVFAFGAGFYAAPNTSLPSLTIMQAAEAAPQCGTPGRPTTRGTPRGPVKERFARRAQIGTRIRLPG